MKIGPVWQQIPLILAHTRLARLDNFINKEGQEALGKIHVGNTSLYEKNCSLRGFSVIILPERNETYLLT